MTQKEAMEILKMGHNVFLTGAPGSGKTFLLKEYIHFLKSHHISVGVTASTGIASTHLNGITIHSWSGIGIKDEIDQKEIRRLLKKEQLKKRLSKTKVLIIDEISMLHAHRLDLVNQVIQEFKSNHFQPFGGIQVVLCGDFFQLPPVSKSGEPPPYFVNYSNVWKDMNPKICYLTEQWRQTDKEYLQVLNDIRRNSVDDRTIDLLKKRYQASINIDIRPTKLYTHNVDVELENKKELAKIKAKPHYFFMETKGPQPLVDFLKQSCLAPEKLILKVGAPVLFLKNNFNKGYVNGTLGKVIGFDKYNELPIIKTADGKKIMVMPEDWMFEEEGKVKAKITQLPLRLAWAITVHKSQGMTLDAVEMDLSKCFEPGMGYVALSRVRSLLGMRLLGMNNLALRINREILEFDKELQSLSKIAENEINKISLKERSQRQEEFLKSSLKK